MYFHVIQPASGDLYSVSVTVFIFMFPTLEKGEEKKSYGGQTNRQTRHCERVVGIYLIEKSKYKNKEEKR